MREVFQQHSAVVDGILKGKPAEAERAMRHHLTETARAYLIAADVVK
jgi:DNA-binding FadR family transcriptional regulator